MNEILLPIIIVSTLCLILVLIKSLNRIEKTNKNFAFQRAKLSIYLPTVILCFMGVAYWFTQNSNKEKLIARQKLNLISQYDTTKVWEAPDFKSMLDEKNYPEIQYGFDLISHTSDYLGPQGIVKNISNGMNCQNCHLQAASKPFGNNYSAVVATYPKFRARSGASETICKRVNDCFQRSLNGQALDSTSKEMNAIKAYITWLGSTVPKGRVPKGSGLLKLKFLNYTGTL